MKWRPDAAPLTGESPPMVMILDEFCGLGRMDKYLAPAATARGHAVRPHAGADQRITAVFHAPRELLGIKTIAPVPSESISHTRARPPMKKLLRSPRFKVSVGRSPLNCLHCGIGERFA
jgi:hypothetical protein